jgi:hypothetical protein
MRSLPRTDAYGARFDAPWTLSDELPDGLGSGW